MGKRDKKSLLSPPVDIQRISAIQRRMKIYWRSIGYHPPNIYEWNLWIAILWLLSIAIHWIFNHFRHLLRLWMINNLICVWLWVYWINNWIKLDFACPCHTSVCSKIGSSPKIASLFWLAQLGYLTLMASSSGSSTLRAILCSGGEHSAKWSNKQVGALRRRRSGSQPEKRSRETVRQQAHSFTSRMDSILWSIVCVLVSLNSWHTIIALFTYCTISTLLVERGSYACSENREIGAFFIHPPWSGGRSARLVTAIFDSICSISLDFISHPSLRLLYAPSHFAGEIKKQNWKGFRFSKTFKQF